MTRFQHFGIIGSGAWGTALAMALYRAGRDVTLWAREAEVVESIRVSHENKKFLPGIALDPAIKATKDLADMGSCDACLLVTPVQHTRSICEQLVATHLAPMPLIVCSKGIEQKNLELPGTIVAKILPQHPLAILSGPTFAAEVARDQPTALTLACFDQSLGAELLLAISSLHFRPYLSGDVIGAQVGGAIKNIMAIACGIVTGCQMGDNARAALMTRGLAEMMRLVLALGGKAETLMGLSGLGDLVLTCSGTQSRNMSLGMALGQGKSLQQILSERVSVAEGVFSASAAVALAQKLNIEMPITEAMDQILNKKASVAETIAQLLARPLKSETI